MTKVNLKIFLLISIGQIIILGSIMTLTTEYAGESLIYSITYILMESIDCANILVTETMMTLKLK